MEQEYWESLCISIGACVYLLSSMLQYLVLQKNSLIKFTLVYTKACIEDEEDEQSHGECGKMDSLRSLSA